MEGGNLFQRIYDRCKRRMGYLEILQASCQCRTHLFSLRGCPRWLGKGSLEGSCAAATDWAATARGSLPLQPPPRLLTATQVAHDVAAGLAYLHPSVVHRDLKPQVGWGRAAGRACQRAGAWLMVGLQSHQLALSAVRSVIGAARPAPRYLPIFHAISPFPFSPLPCTRTSCWTLRAAPSWPTLASAG